MNEKYRAELPEKIEDEAGHEASTLSLSSIDDEALATIKGGCGGGGGNGKGKKFLAALVNAWAEGGGGGGKGG